MESVTGEQRQRSPQRSGQQLDQFDQFDVPSAKELEEMTFTDSESDPEEETVAVATKNPTEASSGAPRNIDKETPQSAQKPVSAHQPAPKDVKPSGNVLPGQTVGDKKIRTLTDSMSKLEAKTANSAASTIASSNSAAVTIDSFNSATFKVISSNPAASIIDSLNSAAGNFASSKSATASKANSKSATASKTNPTSAASTKANPKSAASTKVNPKSAASTIASSKSAAATKASSTDVPAKTPAQLLLSAVRGKISPSPVRKSSVTPPAAVQPKKNVYFANLGDTKSEETEDAKDARNQQMLITLKEFVDRQKEAAKPCECGRERVVRKEILDVNFYRFQPPRPKPDNPILEAVMPGLNPTAGFSTAESRRELWSKKLELPKEFPEPSYSYKSRLSPSDDGPPHSPLTAEECNRSSEFPMLSGQCGCKYRGRGSCCYQRSATVTKATQTEK